MKPKMKDPQDDILFLEWKDDTIEINGRYHHPVTEETLQMRENLLRDFMNVPAQQIKTMIEMGNYIISRKKFYDQRAAINMLFNENVSHSFTDDSKFVILEPTNEARAFVKAFILDEADILKKKLNNWRTMYDSWNRGQSENSL